jgi:hypothetical protein
VPEDPKKMILDYIERLESELAYAHRLLAAHHKGSSKALCPVCREVNRQIGSEN